MHALFLILFLGFFLHLVALSPKIRVKILFRFLLIHMASYKVFFTALFEKKLAGSEKTFQAWIEKILDQFAENPFVGKPLGTKWLRNEN